MGKGNVSVHSKYEGLFYIDYDNYAYENGDFDEFSFADDIISFKYNFMKRFNSFYEVDTWNRDSHNILESELFNVALEDNEWSVAVKLLQKEDHEGLYDYNYEGLQKKHYKSYLRGIKEILLDMYDSIGTYAGPWTSGRIIKKGE